MDVQNQVLTLLQQAIETRSDNGITGELAMAKLLQDYLADADCNPTLLEFAPDRANLIATIKGKTSDRCLVVNGHLDTVPFGKVELWDNPPDRATIQGDLLYGRGSCDMKAGLCALTVAFKQLALEGVQPACDIVLLATADEERYGEGAKSVVQQQLLTRAQAILIAEPTNLQISLGSKGALWVELEADGRSAHGAIPDAGVSAITLIMDVVDALKNALSAYDDPFFGGCTCTLSSIQAGNAPNTVPDHCTATLDIRSIPAIENQEILDLLQQLIEKTCDNHPDCRIKYKVLNQRMAVFTDPCEELVRCVQSAKQAVTGAQTTLSTSAYFTDASIFLLPQKLPAIQFGPGDPAQCHTTNESVEISQVLQSVACYDKIFKLFLAQ